MHEVGLVASALAQAVEAAREVGAERIVSLRFGIAAGGHVTPETVETILGTLTPGTLADSATAEFEWQPVMHYCLGCGEAFVSATSQSCPSCGAAAVRDRATPELALLSIEVEGAGETAPA